MASIIYAVLTNGMGLGKTADLSALARPPVRGCPASRRLCSVARNAAHRTGGHHPGGGKPGHIKAVTAMTGKNLISTWAAPYW